MELLELHLQDYPPSNEIDRLLMTRDIKVAEFEDTARPTEERYRAIHEGNQILVELLRTLPEDSRRFEWRFMLANSLLYDEGQSYFTNILFRGGNKEDREKLGKLTVRALEVIQTLQLELDQQYQQIDSLSVLEFERMERLGFVEQLDRLGPRAEYLNLWILFYDALRRDDGDTMKSRQFTKVIDGLNKIPNLLKTPHDQSRLQIQSLLLAGMSVRRLGDYDNARNVLRSVIAAADRLIDEEELARVQWAVSLAWIERIRVDRDDGRYEVALKHLDHFQDRLHRQNDSTFGMKLVAVLLERSIYQARAVVLEQAGRTLEASTYREQAWRSLMRFAQRESSRSEDINAFVYEMIPHGASSDTLDPFEQCALIAGLLFEAQQEEQSEDLLKRVVSIAEQFLQSADERMEYLIPQVRYNLAVATYRLGHHVEAVQRFMELTKRHPHFEQAFRASLIAVQISSRLYEDSQVQSETSKSLYHGALTWLITKHPQEEETNQWRFYYAQLLDVMEHYDEAALQYSMVPMGEDRDLESLFLRIRAMAKSILQNAEIYPHETLTLRQQADDFFLAYRRFVENMRLIAGDELDASRELTLRNFSARGKLLAAEISSLPQIDRAVLGLEMLKEFETEFTDQRSLFGRLWRLRLLAYEKLDRMDDARRAIPQYVEADPENAGATLQLLYVQLSKEVERAYLKQHTPANSRQADLALILAQHIHQWANQNPAANQFEDDRALLVQLAEANLYAGRYEEAKQLFEQCEVPQSRTSLPESLVDLRILRGYAESQYKLNHFERALPVFNLLAMRLPPTDSMRWRSLWHDLQCRTQLHESPEGIIQVIQQQKFLYPDLGGPPYASDLVKLLRENQRRRDEK